MSVQDVRSDLLNGAGPDSVQSLVNELIGQIANRIGEYVHEVEAQLESLEVSFIETRDYTTGAKNSALRREIAGVRRYLAPERDALEALYSQSRAVKRGEESFQLREQIDRMTRYLEDLDLVKERALVLQEEMMNISMEEQNNRMYALSIVAAIFLPITFVTGVFGMNVMGLPGLEYPDAFFMVATSMVLVTAFVITFFKIKRWL